LYSYVFLKNYNFLKFLCYYIEKVIILCALIASVAANQYADEPIYRASAPYKPAVYAKPAYEVIIQRPCLTHWFFFQMRNL